MTKENREKQYLHFRNLEANYVAIEGKNSGPTSTNRVRARAKLSADKMLEARPELAELDKPKEEAKPEPEKEEEPKKEEPKADSKKKEKKEVK